MTPDLFRFFRKEVLAEKEYIVTDEKKPIKLNQNENPFDWSKQLKAELSDAILASDWNRYPTVYPLTLIEKLSTIHQLKSAQFLVGHGSNELIYSSLWAILEKGDRVLIPTPCFSLYQTVAQLCGAEVIPFLANETTLKVDEFRLVESVKKHQPKITIISSPNNPTGQRISVETVTEICKLSTGLVWLDEAYIEFSENLSLLPRLNEFPNLIILRTFSKAMALAGLRLGYLIAHQDIISGFKRTKVPFTVDQISQIIGLFILDRPWLIEESIKKIMNEKEKFYRYFNQWESFHLFESDTNFFIFKTLKSSHLEVFDSLLTRGILVRNVSSYPLMNGCLRVSIGTPAENDHFLQIMTEINQR